MGFGQFLGAAAPMVVGSFFGPGGTAAAAGFTGAGTQAAVVSGALTGAGIAALNDEDPLMGAVSGGLGGAAGAGLSGTATAAAPTTSTIPSGVFDATSPTLFDAAGKIPSSAVLNTPSTGGQFGTMGNVGTMRDVTMPNTGEALGSLEKSYLNRLGGGSTLTGAGKLGAAGLPAIGAAAMPDYDANPDDDPMAKYDPNRKLNLGMTTGIQNALTRDSGLRLNQFAEGGYLPYRFQNSASMSPEDTEAYRQYMQQRQLEGSMYGQKEAPVYDTGLQQLENERAARMRDPQAVENLRAQVMRRTDPYVGTERQSRDRFNSLMDAFEQERLEIKAMPEGPEKEEIMRGNDNFSRDEFYYNQGGYLETGGRIGDGMSDDINATIEGGQPARLSDGEFVVPADVVSHLGNGSSDAGAEQLYNMMDRIREARTGTEEQGREIMPERFMPA